MAQDDTSQSTHSLYHYLHLDAKYRTPLDMDT
jgi:hypothetical protein